MGVKGPSAIGTLLREDEEAGRKEFALVIARYRGNMLRVAQDLNIHRSHLYRLVKRYRMWRLLARVRERRRAVARAAKRRWYEPEPDF